MSENDLSIKAKIPDIHGNIVFSSEVKEAIEKTSLLPTINQIALLKIVEKLIDKGIESADELIPKVFESISTDTELSNVFSKIIESIT